MVTKKKTGGLIATLSLDKSGGGIAISEFCALVAIVTKKHGKEVTISGEDEEGHMHLQKNGQHLGYIDITTGSLVWDRVIKPTTLMNWGKDWVILGAHLDLEEAIKRHGKEYLEETGKKITGLIWKYARREFTDDGEGQQAYFLYKKPVKGATTPVTVIA